MNGSDRIPSLSQEISSSLTPGIEITTDTEFNTWLLARTFFRPPVSKLPEQLQGELRGQFLADHAWHERPRCAACNQFIERRSVTRRNTASEESGFGRRVFEDRRQS